MSARPRQTAADDPNNPDAVEPDAEVSFVTKDLAPVLPKAKIAAVVALDEILMRVRDASNWRGNSGGVRYATLANATADASGVKSDIKLAYATEGNVLRPLCRLRDARGAGKRHAAAEDQGPGHRRQSQRRTRPRGQEGRQHHLDPARSRRDARGSQGDRLDARRQGPRRRPEGRPEAAHPDGAARAPAPACSPIA